MKKHTLPPLPPRWAAASLLLAAGLAAGCSQGTLPSAWRAEPLRVDGRADDWDGRQTRLEGVPAELLVANDGEALWLGLASSDPRILDLVARGGLTLWIDPRGGQEQTFGIRFPLPSTTPPPRGRLGGGPPEAPRPRLDGLEILGPEPYTRKWVAAPGEGGVEVALATEAGVLVYELRVPLAGGPWGLGVPAGATLGIGVHAARAAGPAMHRGDASGRPEGPPGGGGPGGPDGSGPGSGRMRVGDMPELEKWLRVALARRPSSGAG